MLWMEARVFFLLYSREAGRGGETGPLTGLLFFTGPCRAARRAGVTAQARHAPPGRASTGTEATGLGPGQKNVLSGGLSGCGLHEHL